MINKWKFFIHRVHVNFEREAYREKEGERSSEFTWNLWTKNFHLLIKFYKTWMKKYGHFFETLPSCIFWIKIISFEIIAIFHRTVGDEPGISIKGLTRMHQIENWLMRIAATKFNPFVVGPREAWVIWTLSCSQSAKNVISPTNIIRFKWLCFHW